MISPSVIFGTFDAERTWEDPTLARLPALLPSGPDDGLSAMDELLIGVCNEGDVLATRSPLIDAHRQHLRNAGFSGITFLASSEAHPDAFRGLAATHRFRPWAVTPAVHALWTDLRIPQPLPPLEAVARVNSKVWSAEVRRALGLLAPGAVVRTAREFASVCETLLAAYPDGIVVKEPHGVGGRGSMWIRSAARLRRVVSTVSSQEREGAAVLLVVEPFLRKRFDFSTHATIASDGTVTVDGFRSLRNDGLRYLASCAVSADERAAVGDRQHLRAIERLGEAVYEAGYFGPACIDGMVLEPNGDIMSVVEVNARLSLGAVSASLDRRIRETGARTYLTSIRLSTMGAPAVDGLFSSLDRERLAFDGHRVPGFILLTARTLPSPAAGEGGRVGGPQSGRMFVAVVHSSPEEVPQVLGRVHALLEQAGYQAVDPRD